MSSDFERQLRRRTDARNQNRQQQQQQFNDYYEVAIEPYRSRYVSTLQTIEVAIKKNDTLVKGMLPVFTKKAASPHDYEKYVNIDRFRATSSKVDGCIVELGMHLDVDYHQGAIRLHDRVYGYVKDDAQKDAEGDYPYNNPLSVGANVGNLREASLDPLCHKSAQIAPLFVEAQRMIFDQVQAMVDNGLMIEAILKAFDPARWQFLLK